MTNDLVTPTRPPWSAAVFKRALLERWDFDRANLL